MEAGKDASLTAGGDVTFDTVEKKTIKTTHTKKRGFFSSSDITKTEKTTEQIKSNLSAGGSLNIKSGKDITLAGTDAKAKEEMNFDAAGNLNIIARNNTKQVISQTRTVGFGVGGGGFGVEDENKDAYKSRNVSSNVNAGGDASMKSGKTLKIKGSKLDIAGNAEIDAKNIKVVEGRDIDRTITKTNTTTFYKLDTGSEKSSSDAKSDTGRGLPAQAEAGAEAGYKGNAGFVIAGVTTQEANSYSSKSVGSELKIGKNFTIKAKNEALLRGAEVDVKENINLDAKNVKIMAAQNRYTSKVKTNTTDIGLMIETENEAKAEAEAKAQFGAMADASAEANFKNSVYLTRNTKTETTSLDVTNTGSSIKAGGKLNINAKEKITVKGSELSGDQQVNLKAKDMEFLAAEDIHKTTGKTDTVSAGIYIDGEGKAFAGAKKGIDGGTRASGGVKGKSGAGLKTEVVQSSSGKISTKAVVSTIKFGSGSIERTAENKITDVGTNIEAAGDFIQSAKTIESLAAKDTTSVFGKSQTDTGKLGGYVEGEAIGSSTTFAAGKGGEAPYSRQEEKDSLFTSKAIVSQIKAGGKVKSVSFGKTTFEGTKISGDGGVEIEANELDFKAARDVKKSNKSSFEAGGSANMGVAYGKDAPVSGGAAGNYGDKTKSAESSTATAGKITSGGGISIKTKKDASFEGTKIKPEDNTEINVGGSLKFDAAKSSTEKKKIQKISREA